MNRYIFIGLLCFVIGACTHHTTGFYEGPRYLSFVNEKGADTAFISFANYPGASTHEVAFVLKLTGNIPEEDLTYRLEVVDSLTTAGTTDYQLPEHLVFRKDRVTDTLVVTVMNSNPFLTEQTLSVGLRIVANEHFRPGLDGQQRAKLTFTAVKSKLEWWKGELESLILGEYSSKKMEEFILCTGVNTLEGVELSVARAYTLQFKRYCIEHNIMWDDNVTPMVDKIPCY